jgi:hypothetical protein
MKFFHASPERGAIRAYVPGGIAMEMSVGTSAFPWAGTMRSSALNPQETGSGAYV